MCGRCKNGIIKLVPRHKERTKELYKSDRQFNMKGRTPKESMEAARKASASVEKLLRGME